MALQPVLTVQSSDRPLLAHDFLLPSWRIPVAWILRFDLSLDLQPIQAVSCRLPPFMLCFRRNRFRKNNVATYLVFLVSFKLAFQGPLSWTPVFQAAVRRYYTACLLSVFPCFFLGHLFRVAPSWRPRVPDVQYLAAASFVLSHLFPTFFLEQLHTPALLRAQLVSSCRQDFLACFVMVE